MNTLRSIALLATVALAGCGGGGGGRIAPGGGSGLINVGDLHRWDGREMDSGLDFRGPQPFYQPRQFPAGWGGLP